MVDSQQAISPAPSVSPINRFDWLDSLRGFAALGVILVHCAVYAKVDGLLWRFGFLGQRGVQLFYVVSAFTIFLSMDSRASKGDNSVKFFFIRRFFRIAPLFYFAIIANLIYQGRGPRPGAGYGLSVIDVLSGFLFLHGVQAHTINTVAIGGWSIAVEFTFYALVPLLYYYAKDFYKTLLVYAVMTYVIFKLCWQLAALYPRFDEYVTFLWFPIELPVFLFGILTYMGWKKFVLPWLENATLKRRKTVSALLLVIAAYLIFSKVSDNSTLYWVSAGFVPLVLALSIYQWSSIVNRVTKFLGEISYSIYLLHFFVMIFINKILSSFGVESYFQSGSFSGLASYYSLITLVTLPVAYCGYKYIEQPGIRYGQKLIEKLSMRNKAVASSLLGS